MAIIFSINLLSYIYVITKFVIIAYQTRQVNTNHKEKIILSMKFIFTFGLLWVTGILAYVLKDNGTLPCVFLFLNGLNGAILFLVFVCSKSVFTAIRNGQLHRGRTTLTPLETLPAHSS